MLPPLVKRVTVPLDPETAFSLFTDGIDGWWPIEQHGVFHADSVLVAFDGYAGGSVTETAADGRTASWADIVVWEPPARLVLAWHPWTDPEIATTVEVTFSPGDGGTVVELTHDGWEVLGADAEERFRLYDGGWDLVFGQRYAQAAGG